MDTTSKSLRVLYVASLGPHDTSMHRRWAFTRVGCDVIPFDTSIYYARGNSLSQRIRIRTLIGSAVSDFNSDLLTLARESQPDVVWFDKAVYARAATIKALRALSCYTVHFNPDNPFGPRQDPGWRLFLGALAEYDLHLVPRKSNLEDYRRAGAREVQLKYFDFDPTVHFPPPTGWSDAERPYEVSFLGHPYDNRAGFFSELWQKHNIRTRIWGNRRWKEALSPEVYDALYQGESLWNDAYREAIWKSRVCLSFVTHSNCDDVAYRTFEIAGAGSFMVVENTPEHISHFLPDHEAAFFNSVDDCADKIRRYLPDEKAREKIGVAGHRRAISSGYSNDARIEEALAFIRLKIGKRENQIAGRN